MSVLIPFSVSQSFHQLRRGIAKLQRDRIVCRLEDIVACLLEAHVQRIALGREGKIDGGLRQRHIAFRQTNNIHRLPGRDGDPQSLWIGKPNIFGGDADQPPSQEPRIFSGLDHPRQPIERRIGIGIANRFVKRGNQVVVLFSGTVVRKALPLNGLCHYPGIDRLPGHDGRCQLKCRQCASRIAIRKGDQCVLRLRRDRESTAQSLGREKRTLDRVAYLGFGQRSKAEHLATRQKRRRKNKRRILGGRPDKDDAPLLQIRQENVLLRSRKPMDLVEKQQITLPASGVTVP